MGLGGLVIQCICHAPLLLWKRWFLSETLSSLGSMMLHQQLLLLPLTTTLSYKIYSFLLVLLSYLRNAYFTCSSCTGLTEQRFKARLGHILFLLSPDTHLWEPREGLFSYIPAIETGRKQRTVDKSSLSSLLEALCTTPQGPHSLHLSLWLPHPPQPTLSTFKDCQSHVCLPYVQTRERIYSESFNGDPRACMSVSKASLKPQFSFLTT